MLAVALSMFKSLTVRVIRALVQYVGISVVVALTVLAVPRTAVLFNSTNEVSRSLKLNIAVNDSGCNETQCPNRGQHETASHPFTPPLISKRRPESAAR